MGSILLETETLSHSYRTGPRILEDIDFELEAGDTVGIQGRSGVGKTTLLEIMGTMRAPTSGSVLYEEKSVYELPVDKRARLRGRYLGFVFQEGLLLPDLTLWENCQLAVELSPKDWLIDRTRARFRSLLERLGLDSDRHDDLPSQLSTGERQRLAVARAFMHEPNFIIADEPTGNLDPESSRQLLDLMLPFAERDRTAIIIASHDRQVTDRLSRVYELREGTLKKQDS
jgi:ABC-type lipoprotein export system ATPase subunit